MVDPRLTSLAAALLEVPAPERVLVVGCGDGEPVLLLAREFPAARVRGVDRSPDAVREATGRVGLDPEGRVAFKQARSRSLPYPDAFFDLLVQLHDPVPAAETARVLRPSGHLILAGEEGWLAGLRRRALHRGLARRGLTRVAESDSSGNFFIGRLLEPG